jgi:hypothetical protein
MGDLHDGQQNVTYLDRKDECEDNGSKVRCSEWQPRSRQQVINVVHRTHYSSK